MEYLSNDLPRLAALKASWTYNWSSRLPADTGGMEFVPMVWGKRAVTDWNIGLLTQGRRDGKYKNLLAFNEPDRPNQSNMTPQQAIDLWPRLMETGLRLGSPAPAIADSIWLEAFMSKAIERSYRVDFIALHFYQDFTDPNAVERLKNTITRIYTKYRKPVWITEIGAMIIQDRGEQTPAVPTQQAAYRYMKQALSMLERLSFVERYAWFKDNCWDRSDCRYSSLYDGNDALTSQGHLYTVVDQVQHRNLHSARPLQIATSSDGGNVLERSKIVPLL